MRELEPRVGLKALAFSYLSQLRPAAPECSLEKKSIKKRKQMKKPNILTKVALSAPLVLALGCAVEAASDQDLLAIEDVQSAEQAANESIPISSWNDLVNMGSTGTYHLTQDIDATGKTWTPKEFTGTFDGRKKKSRNLRSTPRMAPSSPTCSRPL